MLDNITLDQIRTNNTYNLISLYEDHDDDDNELIDSPFQYANTSCEYYESDQFQNMTEKLHSATTYFHLNCRGLSANWESFRDLLCDIHHDNFSFDLIGVSEVFRCDNDSRLILPGYHDLITRCRDNGTRGGVGLFVKDCFNYKIRDDLSVFIPHVFESLFIELSSRDSKRTIIGVIYRPNTAPKADMEIFSSTLGDLMDIINNEHKSAVMMGDMNIDLLQFETHNKTNAYIDNIFSHGFIPTITKPTRLTPSSATLIDHIYTNNIEFSGPSGIIITDVADHFAIFHSIRGKIANPIDTLNQTRFFSKANITKFKYYLDHTDFNNIFHIDCPSKAYNEFMSLYRIAFERAFPLRTIKQNKKYIKREPWVTSGLLASSRNKAKLFSKKLHRPTEHNINVFKDYNKVYNKLKRSMKVNYYNLIIHENKFNVKNTWKILKDAIGKHNDKSGFPQEFTINNAQVSDKSQIAESFNKYFSKIGLETSNNVPATNNNYTDYLPNPLPHSMFLEPIEPSLIIETTNKLKTKSSSGHDEISTRILKETIHSIIAPITYIINKSFSAGEVPHLMKVAKVIPVFKSSDSSLLKNYRPISLLTAFSKLLEKIMYDKVISFLNSNNILYKHQYGFRAKHSTIHPIIHLLNHCAIANNKSNSEYTLAVFCDLSKAFDVINHKILLHKLNTYGIRGIVNRWFENYLSNRTQFVDFEGNKSSNQDIHCDVPQGSFLGPLLYLVYVNDISSSCRCNILSFADDTTIYLSDSDINTLYANANIEINNLYKWFCANKLSLNANKTKYIIIRPQQRRCSLTNLNLYINNIALNRVGKNCKESSTKFLGIYIDEFLTWKTHIAHLNSKLSRAIFALKQLKYTLPTDTMRTLYFALIHPHWYECNSYH